MGGRSHSPVAHYLCSLLTSCLKWKADCGLSLRREEQSECHQRRVLLSQMQLQECDWPYEEKCLNRLPGNWKHVKNGEQFPVLHCVHTAYIFKQEDPHFFFLFAAYASHLPTVSHADWLAINHSFSKSSGVGLGSPLCRLGLLLSRFHINLADRESRVKMCPFCSTDCQAQLLLTNTTDLLTENVVS